MATPTKKTSASKPAKKAASPKKTAATAKTLAGKPRSTSSPKKSADAASPIGVGKPAPDFTLTNAKGEKRSLRDYAGEWLVLYFYPRDDTPGCTTEACEFTSLHDEYAGLRARVVGVSPDSEKAHVKFTDKYQLKHELLADPDKSALTAYGAYGKKLFYGKEIVGVLRSTVIVDPKGVVRQHFRNVKAAGHAAAVADALRQLQSAGA